MLQVSRLAHRAMARQGDMQLQHTQQVALPVTSFIVCSFFLGITSQHLSRRLRVLIARDFTIRRKTEQQFQFPSQFCEYGFGPRRSITARSASDLPNKNKECLKRKMIYLRFPHCHVMTRYWDLRPWMQYIAVRGVIILSDLPIASCSSTQVNLKPFLFSKVVGLY